MIKFDLVILDVVSPYSYEVQDLEEKPMGAAEGSIIRLAEGLASAYNIRVAVLQRREDEQSGKAYYLPLKYAEEIEPSVVLHIRGVANLHLWPRAAHFVWCHDVSQPVMKDWCSKLREVNAELIGCSEWHAEDIKKFSGYEKVSYVHSHYEDACLLPIERRPKVNPNQLVWLSSPHKGLVEALPTFEKIRKESPSTILCVSNPGYVPDAKLNRPGVRILGSLTRPELRGLTASSLCLFYPTKFEETFGVVAAEAEALGTPVACYPVAGLKESVQMSGFCKDEDELVGRVLEWQKQRPVVSGSPKFSLRACVQNWYRKLFG